MILNIKATNTTLTDDLRTYVEKKLAPLARLVKGDIDTAMVQVEIGKTTKHHKKGDIFRAEINVQIGKHMLRAECADADLYAAIDGMKDEILREIKVFKTKQETKNKSGGREAKRLMRS